MLRITVLSEPKLSGVGWWRLFRPLQVMRKLHPGAFDIRFKSEKLNAEDAMFSDVVIVSRPESTDFPVEFVEKARMNGAKIIVDSDDDILNLPEKHELNATYMMRRKQIEAVYTQADWFWCSTPTLQSQLGGEVVPNAILPDEIPSAPSPDEGRYAFAGRLSATAHDLFPLGKTWYDKNRINARKWYFIGFMPPMIHGQNAELLPFMNDPQQYLVNVANLRLNGIWKPLCDHPFNDAKSNIALITAAMSGGICVTNYAGRPGWEFATPEIPKYDVACELWASARADIIQNYNLITTARQRAESIARLCYYQPTISDGTANT